MRPKPGFRPENSSHRETQDKAREFLSSIASARHEVPDHSRTDTGFERVAASERDAAARRRASEKAYAIRLHGLYICEGSVLKLRYAQGEASRLLRRVDVPLGQGVSGWVAENAKPMLNGNPAVEPAYNDNSGPFGCLRSAVSVPLSGGSPQLSGALTLYASEANAYNKDHVRILLAVIDKISKAVESAIRFQEARDEPNTGEVTGLPNARSLFIHLQNEVARYESEQKRLAVVVCDLDGFKHVNDNFGHLAGNELLRRVARILQQNCRDTDYVSRMGGDEFVAILAGIRPDELDAEIGAFRRVDPQSGPGGLRRGERRHQRGRGALSR